MDRDTEKVNSEKLKLQQQVEELQTSLSRYETIIAPLAKELVGVEITDPKGQRILMKDKFQLTELVFNNFQTRIK